MTQRILANAGGVICLVLLIGHFEKIENNFGN